MPKVYMNAATVLPPAVLAEVSRALDGRGAYLWVASNRSMSLEQRNQRILDLRAAGWSAERIAALMLLSERTVWRVLAQKRAAAAPSATPSHQDVPLPSNREVTHAQ